MSIKLDPTHETDLRNLIAKVSNGDGLTDQELDKAISFFKELEWRLKILGPHFHHAWRDIYFKLDIVEGFKTARERNR